MDRHSSEVPLLRPMQGTLTDDGGDRALDRSPVEAVPAPFAGGRTACACREHRQLTVEGVAVPNAPVFRHDEDDEEALFAVGGVDFMKARLRVHGASAAGVR